MTMIAYRDGVMAADRTTWAGGGNGGYIVVGKRNKIHRLSRGGLVGGAGDAGIIHMLVKFLENDWGYGETEKIPFDMKDTAATLVLFDGRVFHADGSGCVFPAGEAPFHAEGGGSAFMLGAMAQGATAVQAVALAIKYTEYGGNDPNDIQIERIDKLIKPRHAEEHMLGLRVPWLATWPATSGLAKT